MFKQLFLILTISISTGCSKDSVDTESMQEPSTEVSDTSEIEDTEDTAAPTLENIHGKYERTLTTSDGEVREFIVYVPPSIERDRVPVVFVIHGTNSNGQEFYEHPQKWTPKADAEGFIAVYPTALVHCHFVDGQEMSKTKWASGNLGESDTQLGGLAQKHEGDGK